MRRYLGIIRQQRKPFRFLLSRILMALRWNKFFVIRRGGYSIFFHRLALSSNMWVDPQIRREEEKYLARFIEPGDHVIDIGANVGTISLSLAAAGATVHSFEPHPFVHACLCENITLNKFGHLIVPFNFALGDRSCSVALASISDDTQNRIVEDASVPHVSVMMKSLDDIISKNISAKLIKIDVEGYEGFVLSGAKLTCSRAQYLYLECASDLLAKAGWNEEKLCALVQEYGFDIFHLKGYEWCENVINSHSKKMLFCVRRALN